MELSTIESLLGLGTWEANPELGTLSVSQRASDLLGFQNPQDSTLAGLLDMIPDEEAAMLQVALRSIHDNEMRLTTRSGVRSIKWQRHGKTLHGVVLASRHEQLEPDRAGHQFLGNVSHELRTPLTAIQGYLKLIAQSLEADERRNLDLAIENANRLHLQINNVLEISRIQCAQSTLSRSMFNLREMLAIIDSELGPSAQLKGLQFDVSAGPGVDLAWGDQAKVRHILHALIDNAIKFTHEGRVALLTERTDEWLCISVTDTGIGIDQNTQERMFEPFQTQLDYQMNMGQAMGLGLAICSNFVELMHGRLSVTSTATGSCFKVHLPLFPKDRVTPHIQFQDDDLFEEMDDLFDDDVDTETTYSPMSVLAPIETLDSSTR
ncbi:MAG: HAMP domain-containing sensor histidine kinase, partial [Pseudomonadota bacterium]